MEKTTWEEIKSLASDFKRAQATSTNLKLSERNCIDIINYLCNSKLLSLHFTTDGKTFLTPEELTKEIYEELEFSNGRVALTSLCNSLDLDMHTIENAVTGMSQNDSDIQIVMNCLINSTYIRQVSLKINELLIERGKSNLGELIQLFDLPKMFIEKLITNSLGTIIDAHKDGDMIYTNSFVRRHKAMIRGYLTRSSKTVLISYFTQKHLIPEKLVLKMITDLLEQARLFGKLDNNKSVFVPEIFLKNQHLYLRGFFRQNNYLEFSRMKDVGVLHPTQLAEMEFPDSLILSNCLISNVIVSQLEAAVDECHRSDGFISCYECVPTAVDIQDLQTLMSKVIDSYDNLRIIGQEFVVSNRYVESCFACFDDIIRIKSEEYANQRCKTSGIIVYDNSNESQTTKINKQVKIKSGGGQRGREIKNKVVKNKYYCDKKNEKKSVADKIHSSLEFINDEEAVDLLSTSLADDAPMELYQEMFLVLEKQLESKFRKECQSVILQTSDTAKMKADHQKMEINISIMINKIRLLEKGLLDITNISLRNDLTKYCLRSLCSDLVNSFFEYVAHDNNIEWDDVVTNESKMKVISQLKSELANQLKAINKSLKDESSLDEFYKSFDNLCLALDLFPKKLDKKNEKRLIQEMGAQYHSILDQKSHNDDIDPSELLLLTTLLLFQRIFGYPLHASGKYVPDLLSYLQQAAIGYEDSVDWFSLKIYQNYIITSAKLSGSQDDEKARLKLANKDLEEKILHLALNWKSIKTV